MQKRLLMLGVLVGVVAMVFAACGSEAAPTPRPTYTPVPPTATPVPAAKPAEAAAEPAAKPAAPKPEATRRPAPTVTPTAIPATATPIKEKIKRGGTIRYYLAQDLQSLDPTKIEAFQIYFSIDEVWSNLIQYKSDTYTQVEFIGDLATDWKVSKAGDVYTFNLHPDARWQNVAPLNGRAVTAADVKWTLDLFRNPDYGSQMGARVNFIKEVKALNDKTVEITLTAPANNVLYDFAWVTTKMHARELSAAKWGGSGEGLLGTEAGVVGSGPFVFDQWQKGSLLRATRSNNYWVKGADGDALPYLDALEAVIILDSAVHVAAIRAGQLDFAGITGLNAKVSKPLAGVKGLELKGQHPMFCRILGINNERFPDVRFRKALLLATDIVQIMRDANAAPDMGIETFSYTTTGDYSLPQSRMKEIFGVKADPAAYKAERAKRVAEATQLIKDLGMTGKKIGLLNIFAGSPANEVMALWQQQLKGIGLDVFLETPPRSQSTARRAKGDYDIQVGTLNLQADPIAIFNAQFRTGAPRNYYRYKSAEVDGLIDKAKSEFDKAEAAKLLHQAQEIMWKDVASIPISPGFNMQATWLHIKGYKNNFAWGNQGLKFAWIDK